MISGNKNYNTVKDLPETLPIFPLTGALLLPGGQLPLNIFEPRYIALVDAAFKGDRLIGMIQPGLSNISEDQTTLCTVGCAGRLTSYSETDDQRYIITLSGVSRFKITTELNVTTPFRQVVVDWQSFKDDLKLDKSDREINRASLIKIFRAYLDENNMNADWGSIKNTNTGILVNALSVMNPYSAAEKQALLEAKNLKARADTLMAITEMSLVRHNNDNDATLQ